MPKLDIECTLNLADEYDQDCIELIEIVKKEFKKVYNVK